MATRIEPVVGGNRIDDILLRDFTSPFRPGYVRIFPHGYGPKRTGKGYLLPTYMAEMEKKIREFEIRPDDVWVASYPKTGTTWTQEMVWCIGNDLDFERAKATKISLRFPFVEISGLARNPVSEEDSNTLISEYYKDSLGYTERMESPRYIKTHLPWEMLPDQIKSKKTKIIYISRNPKDTFVSYFHHSRLLEGYKGTFEDYVDLFLHDTVPYSPYWDHILSYWDHRDDSNVLLIKYEDMIKDLPSVIAKVFSFLGKEQPNDESMKTLCDHLSFESMKANDAVNYEYLIEHRRVATGLPLTDEHFMRKGKANTWKEEISPELAERFDEWTKECLKGTQLPFN